MFDRANLENGWTDFDDSFFVGTLRTPINTWATFLPEKVKQRVKKGRKQVKNGIFFMFFACFRLYLENLGQYARSLRTTFCCSKTYIKKVKKVKNRSQMASFMFLPVSDYFSEISSPKATKSRAVGPFTTNDVFVYRNIHRKRSKKVKNRSQILFFHVFCPF